MYANRQPALLHARYAYLRASDCGRRRVLNLNENKCKYIMMMNKPVMMSMDGYI